MDKRGSCYLFAPFYIQKTIKMKKEQPNRFDEVLLGEDWTKAVMQPGDYRYVNKYITPFAKSEYQMYLAKVNLQDKGIFYRTKIDEEKSK